jgi:hypothetical protein
VSLTASLPEGLLLGWTLAVSIEGACVGLVLGLRDGGLAGAVREFTASPPLQM